MREQQHLALRLGELGDGARYSLCHFTAQRLRFGRSPIHRFPCHTLLSRAGASAIGCGLRRRGKCGSRCAPDRNRNPASTMQKAFLYDILGIGHRSRKPPGEAEQRKLVLVQEPQKMPLHLPCRQSRIRRSGAFAMSEEYYQMAGKESL